MFWTRYKKALLAVDEATSSLSGCCDGLIREEEVSMDGEDAGACLPPIANLINAKVKGISEMVSDRQTWPPLESVTSIPMRLCSAFGLPSKDTIKLKFCNWAVHSFAWRFAVTFTLAMLPEMFLGEGYRAHWLPMTTALIMVPEEAANYEKITHRVIGTLMGLLVGTACLPLYDYVVPHILLLGLSTFSVVCFFPANYACFTFSVTCWVVTTVIGVGAPWNETILFRVIWTLAAGLLVLVTTLAAPTKSNIQLGSKLAALARATKRFSIVAMEEHDRLCREVCGNDQLANNAAIVSDARHGIITARVALLQSLSEAAKTPGAWNFAIDPHSVAPAIASDLIEAAVVTQTLLLVPCGSVDGLIGDINDQAYEELDRLVRRLTEHGDLRGKRPVLPETVRTTGAEGPFSRAIERAHKRLDEINFPSEVIQQARLRA